MSASVQATDHYEQGHTYLVRPDAYVSLSTRADNMAAHLGKLGSFMASAS